MDQEEMYVEKEDNPFIDPSRLKEAEKESDGEIIYPDQPHKERRSIKWPAALLLMLTTLIIGIAAGIFLITLPDTVAPIETTDFGENRSLNEPLIAIEESAGERPIPLTLHQESTSEGQFTEWYLNRDRDDEAPHFFDATWHPGTERVYMVAHDTNLYWVGSGEKEIEFVDLSLRLGISLPFLDSIATLDSDRLVLQMDNNEPPLVVYNIKENRVEARFGTKSEDGTLGTYDLIADRGIAAGPDGKIYLLNSYKKGDEWHDQVQVFSGAGEPLQVIEVVRGADTIAVNADGELYVNQFNGIDIYDKDGEFKRTLNLDIFSYAEDMTFSAQGNLYVVGPFDAWLAEVEANGELGRIFPAAEYDNPGRSLGEVSQPRTLIAYPDGQRFLIIDGLYDLQRIFLFEPTGGQQ